MLQQSELVAHRPPLGRYPTLPSAVSCALRVVFLVACTLNLRQPRASFRANKDTNLSAPVRIPVRPHPYSVAFFRFRLPRNSLPCARRILSHFNSSAPAFLFRLSLERAPSVPFRSALFARRALSAVYNSIDKQQSHPRLRPHLARASVLKQKKIK